MYNPANFFHQPFCELRQGSGRAGKKNKKLAVRELAKYWDLEFGLSFRTMIDRRYTFEVNMMNSL